jgi:hypothetical protein
MQGRKERRGCIGNLYLNCYQILVHLRKIQDYETKYISSARQLF